jgi:hypothetical protein
MVINYQLETLIKQNIKVLIAVFGGVVVAVIAT